MNNISTLKLVQGAVGMEKVEVVARAVDELRDALQTQEQSSQTVDDEIATLSLNDLAESHGLTLRALRTRICEVMGSQSAIKLGRTWIIRKSVWLEYLRKAEAGE